MVLVLSRAISRTIRSLSNRVDVGTDIVENRGLGLLGVDITH